MPGTTAKNLGNPRVVDASRPDPQNWHFLDCCGKIHDIKCQLIILIDDHIPAPKGTHHTITYIIPDRSSKAENMTCFISKLTTFISRT